MEETARHQPTTLAHTGKTYEPYLGALNEAKLTTTINWGKTHNTINTIIQYINNIIKRENGAARMSSVFAHSFDNPQHQENQIKFTIDFNKS